MKKSCQYCGKIHDMSFLCQKKKRKFKSTEESHFRSSSKWTKKSLEIKERDLFLCRICLEKGIAKWDGLEVHHIVPISENFDLRLEDQNLITLCQKHHKEAERSEISRTRLMELAKVSPRGIDTSKIETCARPHSSLCVQNFPEMTEKGENDDGKTG